MLPQKITDQVIEKICNIYPLDRTNFCESRTWNTSSTRGMFYTEFKDKPSFLMLEFVYDEVRGHVYFIEKPELYIKG